MRSTGNIVVDKSFSFALDILDYAEDLEERRKFVVSNQLTKSGTSIGANVHEAQNAESRADFIHKIKIAAKEADEAEYWILLCMNKSSYPYPEGLFDKLKELQRLLNKIIKSAKDNATMQ